MKIDVAKDDLQILRDLVWEGRAHYLKSAVERKETIEVATKHIKKINSALKKAHGHDCNGEHYV